MNIPKNIPKYSKKEMLKRKQMALEHLFWKCNRLGNDVMPNTLIDNYKSLQEATEEEREAIYNYICDRLGFSSNQLSNEQYELLVKNGYLKESKEE